MGTIRLNLIVIAVYWDNEMQLTIQPEVQKSSKSMSIYIGYAYCNI